MLNIFEFPAEDALLDVISDHLTDWNGEFNSSRPYRQVVGMCVDCNAYTPNGDWHKCERPITDDERRRANRERVAKSLFVDAYDLYTAAEDAWTRERVNLTALLRKEII